MDADSGSLALVASTGADAVRSNETGPTIQEYRREPSENLSGILRDWVRRHALSRARAHLILSRGQYELMRVERPQVPPEDLVSTLRWKLGAQLGYPASEATIAVLEGPTPAESAPARQVNVAVAHIERLRPLVDAVQGAGLHVQKIGIADLALGAVAQRKHPVKGGFGVLHLSDENAHLVLFRDSRFDMARTFTLPTGNVQKIDRAQVVLNEVQRTLDFYESRYRGHGTSSLGALHLLLDRYYAAWLPRVLNVELPLPVTVLEHPTWQGAAHADAQPLALGGWLEGVLS